MTQIDDRVILYVHELRRRGHPDHKIKAWLKQAGHQEASIDEHMAHPNAFPATPKPRRYQSLILIGAAIIIIALVILLWPEEENRREQVISAKARELTPPRTQENKDLIKIRGMVNSASTCAQGYCINISANASDHRIIALTQPPEHNASAGDWVEATCTPRNGTCFVDHNRTITVQRTPQITPVMIR